MNEPVAALSVFDGVADVHLHIAARIFHRVRRVVGRSIIGIARSRKNPYRAMLVTHDVALILRVYTFHPMYLLTPFVGNAQAAVCS